MYTTKTANVPIVLDNINSKKSLNININSVTDRMSPSIVNYGDGIYMTKDCGFKNFNDITTKSFHYWKNIIPTKTVRTIPCLYFEGIVSQLESEDELKILSSHKINSIYGQTVSSKKILIDNTTKTIYTSDEKVLSSYISGLPISYDYQTFSPDHLMYIDRALGIIPLIPKLERIVHPLNSYLYRNIYEKVEQQNDSTYVLKTPKIPSPYSNITFYRPLYLFSTDKTTWKRWNGSTFVQPAGFSSDDYDKMVGVLEGTPTGGNTYDEMIGITDEEWSLLVGDSLTGKCWVLCNSYVPVIEVSHDMAQLSDSEFMYISSRTGRYIIQKGSV